MPKKLGSSTEILKCEDPFIIAEDTKDTIIKPLTLKCMHDAQCFPDGISYCKICSVFLTDDIDECLHENLIESPDGGSNYCSKCGKESMVLDFGQDWRWFGPCDNRVKKDPNRCHTFKSAPKGIKPTFEKFGISITAEQKKDIITKHTEEKPGARRFMVYDKSTKAE